MSGASTTSLPRLLISEKLVTEQAIRKIPSNEHFITEIVNQRLVDSTDLMKFLSSKLNHSMVNIDVLDPSSFPSNMDKKMVQQYRMIPMSIRGNKVTVLLSDPTNTPGLDAFRF